MTKKQEIENGNISCSVALKVKCVGCCIGNGMLTFSDELMF